MDFSERGKKNYCILHNEKKLEYVGLSCGMLVWNRICEKSDGDDVNEQLRQLARK